MAGSFGCRVLDRAALRRRTAPDPKHTRAQVVGVSGSSAISVRVGASTVMIANHLISCLEYFLLLIGGDIALGRGRR